jgi:hypothetical protein
MSEGPTFLPYATPVERDRLPWWMILSATFVYLALAGCAAIAHIVSSDLASIGLVYAALISFGVVEGLALMRDGAWRFASIFIIILSAVAGFLVPFALIGMTIVMHQNGPWSAFEQRMILAGASIAAVCVFVAASHLRWWARVRTIAPKLANT